LDLDEQIRERRRKAKLAQEEGGEASLKEEDLVTRADENAFIIPIHLIEIRTQARKTFHDLEKLAKTIKERGQLQPIVVKKLSYEKYLLIDGERRLRAIRDTLRQKTIRAVLQERALDGAGLRLTQLIANKQRDDYPPLELAAELIDLKETYDLTDAKLAEMLGVDPSWIYKQRSLGEAPDDIKAKIREGKLAITTYLNNKNTMLEKRKRKVFIKLPIDKALTLAKLLQKLAERNEKTSDIDISKKPKKKELLAILSKCAPELLALFDEQEEK